MSETLPTPSAPRPYTLIAELTYRCPLKCVYCSNPLNFAQAQGELSFQVWQRVFGEAAKMGILQLHLTGGEPLARTDIVQLVEAGHDAGLYTNLITSGMPLTEKKLSALRDAGLDHVQLSIQDADSRQSDTLAGVAAFERKRLAAAWVRKVGLALTLNIVLHRLNIGNIDALINLGLELGAERLELANTQYYAWALTNRAQLLPSRKQVDEAAATVQQWRSTSPQRQQMEIAFVKADYYADYPKPCMDGWAQKTVCITPVGTVLPCHAAQIIPNLDFESVIDKPLADIWQNAPGMNAFRGEAWMQEPCKSCPRRQTDFAGCRCQAQMLTGDARAADPVCHLSPHHSQITAALQQSPAAEAPWVYRTAANSRKLAP